MKDVIEYICGLHGYLIRLKEFHWAANTHSEHVLCDSAIDKFTELEDEIAESSMGLYGKKIGVNDLKPLLPNSETIEPMLKELQKETIDFKKTLKRDEESGLANLLDEVIASAQKFIYLSKQK